MKPPLCRSCWKAEWNHVCPKQAALSPRAAQQQPIGDLRAMDDDNFRVAYNAVMAEYMRRRRAKQKATWGKRTSRSLVLG